jgi:transposase
MANKKYTKEFKLDAVRLALSSDKSQAQVARDLGLRDNVLYNWISQYRGEVLESTHHMTPAQELTALKKEVAQLKQEREILKKAAAYFAKYHT